MSTVTQDDAPSATHQTPQRCAATRKDGNPCTRRAVPDSPLCVFHDPRATDWRSQGGKATRRSAKVLRLLPDRLRPIIDVLISAIDEVHAGTLAPAQASAMASLASAVCKVFAQGEMEERLRELERRAAAQTEVWQHEPQPSIYPTAVYAVPAERARFTTPASVNETGDAPAAGETVAAAAAVDSSLRAEHTPGACRVRLPAKPKAQPAAPHTPTYRYNTTTAASEAALRERWLTGGARFDGQVHDAEEGGDD